MGKIDRPLFIPVILGTVRKGRMSEHAAQQVHAQLEQCEGVKTELIDIRQVAIRIDDAG
jgi:NAD(P)H-dependent FMN reductase